MKFAHLVGWQSYFAVQSRHCFFRRMQWTVLALAIMRQYS